MAYDYREAVKEDAKQWVIENIDILLANIEDREDVDGAVEFLYDTLWTEDSVTGNASGSYTFNRAEAKEYVTDNMELACEALNEFGYSVEHLGQKIADEEWEYLDVTIRCYLLGEAVSWVVDTLSEDDFE